MLIKRNTAPAARRRIAALAAVALLLLAAETFAAWHQTDLEAHATDGLCKTCLTISSFSNGNVGHADSFACPVASQSRETAVGMPFAFRSVSTQRARGPPNPS
jgi:hypothetical protein